MPTSFAMAIMPPFFEGSGERSYPARSSSSSNNNNNKPTLLRRLPERRRADSGKMTSARRSCSRCWLVLLVVCGCLLRLTESRPGYVGLIPNGDKIPGERRPMASGHVSPQGHGARNQFGEDFQAAGLKWTPELCQKDSDGDGRTNGEELGDPDCVWKAAKKGKSPPPARTSGITHPGVPDSVPIWNWISDKVRGLFEKGSAGEL
mmetsp:Transcript_13912/g.30292  ORF Transcript_13912/g.30292 Transcript_13912/m.30292 type:complete len:205 (+) Transcript_13912:258-872(+)